ncbi:MAG: Ig-like domain-containing protein [Clostridia bacterium]|nr:Ig-like domain-containing protein [Clostridia bacterium]
MKKKIDIIVLSLVAVAFFAVAALNIYQPNRPTESQTEQRTLAKFPEFSVNALLDGSYFADIDLFVSDTFLAREELISFAKEWKLLYGLPANDDDVHFITVNPQDTEGIEIDIPEITERESESESEPESEEIIIMPPVTTDTEEESTDTDGEETSGEETSCEETSGEETTQIIIKPIIESVSLSDSEKFVTVGDTFTLTVKTIPENSNVIVKWRNTNSAITQITPLSDGLEIKALAAGKTTITAIVGGKEASCTVNISVSIAPVEQGGGSSQIITEEPEILTSGLVIYKDAVYSIPYYVAKNASQYAKMCEYLASLFPNSNMSVVTAPLSSAMLELDTFGKGRITDQNKMINNIDELCNDTVNVVNCFGELWTHRDEYLYFKSDHHWTSRGAYYAYKAFCESVGIEPAKLEDMEENLISTKFRGTMYAFTGDERVKSIVDSIYAYMPTKEHTMTIYKNGTSYKYSSCILPKYGNYGAFLTGDNPYTIINVPENPQDMNILVFKDSYGNAFVPYLCENYGNIIVVDPRHVSFNVYELLRDYPLRDVLIMNNMYNPNVASWTMNILRSVGVE